MTFTQMVLLWKISSPRLYIVFLCIYLKGMFLLIFMFLLIVGITMWNMIWIPKIIWYLLYPSLGNSQEILIRFSIDKFLKYKYLLSHIFILMVHKMIIPWKKRWTEEKYLDLNLMEFLHTKVKINLPGLINKNLQMILLRDDKRSHALVYAFGWVLS